MDKFIPRSSSIIVDNVVTPGQIQNCYNKNHISNCCRHALPDDKLFLHWLNIRSYKEVMNIKSTLHILKTWLLHSITNWDSKSKHAT